MKFQISNCKLPMLSAGPDGHGGCTRSSRTARRPGFSMVEILVVVSLLSLIVLALMAVFSGTQRAFRASVTQSGVLEGSRATMELVTRDLRGLTPSDGAINGAVNFYVANNASYSTPLIQSLPGTANTRQNLLQEIFILNYGMPGPNQSPGWWGVAYAIGANNPSANLYTSLYRLQYPAGGGTVTDPGILFTNPVMQNFLFTNPATAGGHLMDGVVHFIVRAYSPAGYQINANYTNEVPGKLVQTAFSSLQGGESGLTMYGNNLPVAVELQLGVLEDQILATAQSLPATSQSNYLSQQSGAVHVFRQRVSIPNVDITAYP